VGRGRHLQRDTRFHKVSNCIRSLIYDRSVSPTAHAGYSPERHAATDDDVPLLPGTLTIYRTRGSCFFCVGFRG
jgi:hypothetical protein